MSVRVRLTRVGSRKNPIWRVVVADQRSPRDGRFIEAIGRYNPQTEPSTISIDEERLQHWLARGAQPTGTVKQLIKAQRASGVAAAEPAREPPVEATPEPEAEATPETAVASGTGEGQPESALPGEPAPGADGLIADPEVAAAERSSAVEGAPPAEGDAVAEGPASAEGDAAAERAAPPADRDAAAERET